MRFAAGTRRSLIASVVLFALLLSRSEASAQGRDSLLNGAIIGAAVGAGVGVAFTHAVRDSDLTAGQYAYGGVVFGAIGAGIGLGVDALIGRSARHTAAPPRFVFVPAAGRARGVAMQWRW